MAAAGVERAEEMNIQKIIDDLRDQHDLISQAISSMERLNSDRGRPRPTRHAWSRHVSETPPQPSVAGVPKRRGRPPGRKNHQRPITVEMAAGAMSEGAGLSNSSDEHLL